MEELNTKIKKYQKDNLNDALKRDYISSLKDEKFASLVKKLRLKDEVGMKYTSKLEHTIDNLKNCEKCSFRKTIEQYKSDRLKYRDKEIAYLAKHGIKYRGD